jgi:hypothetical protein
LKPRVVDELAERRKPLPAERAGGNDPERRRAVRAASAADGTAAPARIAALSSSGACRISSAISVESNWPAAAWSPPEEASSIAVRKRLLLSPPSYWSITTCCFLRGFRFLEPSAGGFSAEAHRSERDSLISLATGPPAPHPGNLRIEKQL